MEVIKNGLIMFTDSVNGFALKKRSVNTNNEWIKVIHDYGKSVNDLKRSYDKVVQQDKRIHGKQKQSKKATPISAN